MNIHKHWSCNDVLNPASGDEGDVAPLPINRRELNNCRVTSSFWKPTADELLWLQSGGVVMLSVLSSSHAPVRVDVVSDDKGVNDDIALLLKAHSAGAFQNANGKAQPPVSSVLLGAMDRVLAALAVQHV